MHTILIIYGPQSSGKSTLASAFFAAMRQVEIIDGPLPQMPYPPNTLPASSQIRPRLVIYTTQDAELPAWVSGENILVLDVQKFSAATGLSKALSKARRWDALEAKIAACYGEENEDGEFEEFESDEEGGDLIAIGEIAASAFGYL